MRPTTTHSRSCQGLVQLHGPLEPLQVPQHPLKLRVVAGETEAWRRRDHELTEPMQRGKSRAGEEIGES